MKKALIFTAWFAAGFCVLYLSLCFLVPSLRIKLAATPTVYFWKSIRHMAGLKALISAGAGILAGGLATVGKNT